LIFTLYGGKKGGGETIGKVKEMIWILLLLLLIFFCISLSLRDIDNRDENGEKVTLPRVKK
jgi:hypothetical protein